MGEQRLGGNLIFGMLTAGLIIGQQVAAKAIRETLFLSSFDVRLLPRMLVAAAVVSALVTLSTTRLRVKVAPVRLTWVLCLASSATLALAWFFQEQYPQAVAVAFYLHTMSFGPLIATAFWSILNEALDPRTAKRAVGRISAAGTAGALLGGLAAERIGAMTDVRTVLLFLTGLHAACLISVPWLASKATTAPRTAPKPPDASEGSVEKLLGHDFFRSLGLLVALIVTAAALLDYALKVEAVASFETKEELLRFFAGYYVAMSGLSFLAQLGLGRTVLEKAGVARTLSILPLATAAISTAAIALPGLIVASVARGIEGILRSSLYRASYELLYTPVDARDKRAVKPLVDIVVDRTAEAVSGGLITLMLWAWPTLIVQACFGAAAVVSAAALLVIRRLKTGYIDALARRLGDFTQVPAAAALLHEGTLTMDARGALTAYFDQRDLTPSPSADPSPAPKPTDGLVRTFSGLISADREKVRAALTGGRPLDDRLVSTCIGLLDSPHHKLAAEALQEVGLRHLGQFTDVLADHQDETLVLRKRVARLLGNLPDPRAIDGLTLGLSDPRFEVRARCGRSLLKLRAQDERWSFAPERAFDWVRQELAHWQDTRQRPSLERDADEEIDFIDELVETRSGHTLEHVFRLISLALPLDAVQQAFRGALADDPHLQGTALEYLENVVPADVWSMLEKMLSKG